MTVIEKLSHTRRIRELNDALRRSFLGGKVMLTSGINALDDVTKAKVLEAVQTFDKFDGGNDPHAEHDFVSVEVDGHKVFGKLDYYSPSMDAGSENPADPRQTTRVLTIMLASEY